MVLRNELTPFEFFGLLLLSSLFLAALVTYIVHHHEKLHDIIFGRD